MTETKVRNRTGYHVLHELESGIWQQITHTPDESAVSRKDAITKASHGMDENGSKFLAIRESEIKPMDKPKAKGASRLAQLQKENEELRRQLAA